LAGGAHGRMQKAQEMSSWKSRSPYLGPEESTVLYSLSYKPPYNPSHNKRI
jgi:hypothetical protein